MCTQLLLGVGVIRNLKKKLFLTCSYLVPLLLGYGEHFWCYMYQCEFGAGTSSYKGMVECWLWCKTRDIIFGSSCHYHLGVLEEEENNEE